MKYYFNKRSFALILSIALVASSCKKFVEIDPPINSFISSTAFDTNELVEANITGLHSYNFLTSAYHDTYRHIFPGFSSDELVYYTNAYDEFVNNQILVTNAVSRYMWSEPYKAIYQSNLMLEALEKSTKISEEVKSRAMGTAKFFRALSYLNLVSLFGDVPLIVTADVRISATTARTPKAQVYAQIINDLKEAKAALKTVTGKVLATEKAATALLARAYLYNKEWQNAVDTSTELISGPLKGNLKLEAIDKVFLRSSAETILSISSDGSVRTVVNHTYAGRSYIPGTVRTLYNLTDNFLQGFEAADARKANWIRSFTGSTGTTWYPYKYKLNAAPANTANAEDQILLRLGELYLIRAEAYAELNKPELAVLDINDIRQRASLGALPVTITKADALLAVEKERRYELFSEYGHRWVDLVRTNRAQVVLKALKGSHWNDYAVLYPIAEKEIELNRTLTQNSGYDK